VLTIGIAMRNLTSYDSAGPIQNPVKYERLAMLHLPVPFGIPVRTNEWSVMQNPKNYSGAISSAN